ncbi:MAG: amino acid permease [Desulfocapsaceae bacterium]|nr:amino acid permease [Desulfocapsaceae bacterium]
MNRSQKNNSADSGGTLGTFGGVFTPSILTILGIILFLRMGFMVGSGGLFRALLIVSIANIVSILTSVSMSAAATNIQVKGGGAYYLISRALGVRFGGSIGIVLFLAQSVSIAFYCIGFAEALVAILPPQPLISAQSVSIVAVLFLFFMAWLGADWATKFQYVVMGLLVIALISFFAGALLRFDSQMLAQNWKPPAEGLPFWVLFALFFPAVTGFTQGVNMSGDLKDPGKSIPRGTFWAVGISALIYFAAALVFAGSMSNAEMIADYDAMKRLSSVPWLVTVGVLAATLSSAMASFLGAPRILQSLAADRIFSFLNPFSVGHGDTNNPRRGLLLSGTIALLILSFGHLNLVAGIVSMFFLISYALLNYATFYESRTNSPFFRPRFKYFRPWMSLAGFLTCAGAMFAINISTGIIAFSIIFAIYQYLKHYSGPPRWADSRRSYFLQKARENIHAAALEKEHARDWRPVILAMTRDSGRLHQIMGFAAWVEGKSGFTSAVRIIQGQGAKVHSERKEAARQLSSDLLEIKSTAFPLVLTGADISEVLPALIQSYGIGPIKANTLLVNWIDDLGKGLSGLGAIEYARNLMSAFRQGLNVMILDTDLHKWDRLLAKRDNGHDHIIDVWWDDSPTGNFMLLIAYLVSRNELFERALIRMITRGEENDTTRITEQLKKQMEDVRIDAEPLVVPDINQQTIVEISADSSMVLMPFGLRDYHFSDAAGGSLARLLPQLPLTVMIKAAQDIDLEAEPDEGYLGDLAAASDAVERAQKTYRTIYRQAQRLKAEADGLTLKLSRQEADDEGRASLIADSDEAIKAYEDGFRKAAKARVKVETAVRELEKMAETGE